MKKRRNTRQIARGNAGKQGSLCAQVCCNCLLDGGHAAFARANRCPCSVFSCPFTSPEHAPLAVYSQRTFCY